MMEFPSTMRRAARNGALIAAALATLSLVVPAQAAEETLPPKDVSFGFEGPFGVFDRAQLQRGYKVYVEVCSGCDSIDLLAFRNLGDAGGPQFPQAVVRALAADFPRQVIDGPDDTGEMFERPGIPSDRIPAPFPNEAAARASNGGALPPDFSVLAKARPGGPAYIHSILTGYEDPPQGEELRPGLYYNPYFPGHQIAMAPPLAEGMLEYTDGSPETVEQYSRDVSAFLMWAAEPKMVERKRMGFQVMLFLVVLAGLLYFTKRKLWRDIH